MGPLSDLRTSDIWSSGPSGPEPGPAVQSLGTAQAHVGSTVTGSSFRQRLEIRQTNESTSFLSFPSTCCPTPFRPATLLRLLTLRTELCNILTIPRTSTRTFENPNPSRNPSRMTCAR